MNNKPNVWLHSLVTLIVFSLLLYLEFNVYGL
jgi:hypothetical protein